MGRPILLDRGTLNDDFVPKNIQSRQQHVSDMLNYLGPVKSDKSAVNLFLHGPPGSGKSTVTRWVLDNHFKGRSVYLNCWNNPTQHKILQELLKQLGFVIHGKESTSELISRFQNLQKRVIVCLDEFDGLKEKGVLYLFIRNSYPLVLISDRPYSPFDLDARTRSGLILHEMEFGRYEKEHISEILNHRIETGMNRQAVPEEAVTEIARCCGGDARAAIQILKNAVLHAEANDHDSIMPDTIQHVSKNIRMFRLSYVIRRLNEHQKAIYEILKEKKSMDSGALFDEYRKSVSVAVTDRCYRKYMTNMVDLGLVREVSANRWKKYEIAV